MVIFVCKAFDVIQRQKSWRLGSGKSHFSSLDFPLSSKINNNKRVSPNDVGFLNVRYLCDFLVYNVMDLLYVHFTRFRTFQFFRESSPGAITTSINRSTAAGRFTGATCWFSWWISIWFHLWWCEEVAWRFTAAVYYGRRFKNEGGWDWWESRANIVFCRWMFCGIRGLQDLMFTYTCYLFIFHLGLAYQSHES